MSKIVRVVTCAVLCDMVTSILLWSRLVEPGPALKHWYKSLGFTAVAMDVLSLALGTYAGMWVARQTKVPAFVGVTVVTLAHDLIFGLLLDTMPMRGGAVEAFRKYKAEKGARILVDDLLMTLGTLAISEVLVPDVERNIAQSGLALYATLFMTSSL